MEQETECWKAAVAARIRLLLFYVAVALPLIVWGASQVLKSSSNSPLDWVGEEFAAKADYDSFAELFGPGDVIVVSWDGCTWDNPDLDRLLRLLRHEKYFRNGTPQPWLYSVASGRESLLQLTGKLPNARSLALAATEHVPVEDRPDDAAAREIPLETAIERLQGFLIGPDGKTTCLILTVTADGLKNRSELVNTLRKAVFAAAAVPDTELRLAGPVIDGLTVDEASQQSLARYAAPSSILIFLICWLSLRSLRAAMIVFACAGFCQGATLAVIYYCGDSLSALLIILPPLIQVLAVAGGIHLTNYYFDAQDFPDLTSVPPAVTAFHRGWLPCVLSAGTTAMGTASLMISELTPIRLFGVYATVGVLLTAASVLALVPGFLLLFPVTRSAHRLAASGNPSRPSEHARSGGMWKRLADTLHFNNSAVLASTVGLMVLAAAGLPQITTSIRIETLFSSESRIISDYRWLEENIAPLVPIEVLVRFDSASELSDRQRMKLLYDINKAIEQVSEFSATTSALTFIPPVPQMRGVPPMMKTVALNQAVSRSKTAFESAGYLRHSVQGEYWRITARTSALRRLDYGQLLSEVDHAAQSKLASEPGAAQQVSVQTSGIMPLVHEIQGRLLQDLFWSLMSALAVITITMTLVEAGIISGLIAMVSNVFPIVCVFGVMGWWRHPMDIGSVMTASVALGIAVDDTLHFLTFFRRGLSATRDRRQAVLFAYQHCGKAMIQTSFSCGLGLLVFSLSDFVPTGRFAVLMVTLLLLALVGDLIVLPALLLSPIGRCFVRHTGQLPAPLPDVVSRND
ncbi:MAG: MMPL family transporter [Planctomycetaceae bacterium]|nr:MMPL family transporter [Planctomycetaceae bacterium]